MNVVRRWCVKISTHEDFEFVVFILIFINIVTLAMYNPLKTEDSGYNFYLDRIRKSLTFQILLSTAVQSKWTGALSYLWSCLLACLCCISVNKADWHALGYILFGSVMFGLDRQQHSKYATVVQSMQNLFKVQADQFVFKVPGVLQFFWSSSCGCNAVE